MNVTANLPVKGWSLEKRCDTIATFWSRHWSALQLTILRERGEDDLVDFKERILLKHQRGYFLDGLKKLNISLDQPPAVIAGQYHYLSNILGGLELEYIVETPKKVWIRYLPPCWSFPGNALFSIPSRVQQAMFRGWHPNNGPSLGHPRLAFIVTKIFQDGEPYDEGYFLECDRDLHPEERIQFLPVTSSPDFEPDKAPKIDPNVWPPDRRAKAKRNFARGYLVDGTRTALEMYGLQKTAQFLAQGSRLVAVQYFHEYVKEFGITGKGPADFAQLFSDIASLSGDEVSIETRGNIIHMHRGNSLFNHGNPVGHEIYEALFQFAFVGAKILNPRLRVSYAPPRLTSSGREDWTIELMKDRTF